MTQSKTLPNHVGIIMDGNGRWATARGLSRNRGHQRGAEVFGEIVRHAKKLGIPYLTVYAFSTENWNRPPEEVAGIMNLLRSYLRDANRYRKENVKTLIIGDRTPLDADLIEMIAKVEEGSRNNTGIHVNIGLNYGGRNELVHAARKIAAMMLEGSVPLQGVDHALLESCLYTAGQPDVDLIIRTGGEQRISNFLLWQGAYAEFIFTPTLWPDFTAADLDAALEEYSRRERRMGGI
jgi:undecaprenyl diphosphate synthase